MLMTVVALLAALGAQAATPRNLDNELRALEERRRQAIREGDRATLERIYADDFQGVVGNGVVIDRATLMGVLTRPTPGVKFTTTEIAVKPIAPGTALFTGRLTGALADGTVVNDARFTHLFVERDGRWQCIAGQSTPFPVAPPRRGAFFAISARDAAATAAWYGERLGFETLRQGTAPDGAMRFALLRRRDDLIEIVQRASAVMPPAAAAADRSYELGTFKVGFWVDDLAGLNAKLKAQATAFKHGIVTPSGANYQTFAVTDPDGNVVQFFGDVVK
jgi:catechol 2,3-dioxygenase-like lactoylglutathione lyase family enzyme